VSIFERAFANTVGEEGGYTTNPADPGNWTGGAVNAGELKGTNYGISAASYPALDISGLTLDQAHAIYRRDYWDRLRADDLPPALALLAFDAAVNNGVGRARAWLILAERPDTKAACIEFMAQRTFFMGGLHNWQIFGLGWSRRLARLPYEAADLIAAEAPGAVPTS
jgi:lysozyme family protein